eukprot:7722854-Lingulodinium_polyedra.AAC.1
MRDHRWDVGVSGQPALPSVTAHLLHLRLPEVEHVDVLLGSPIRLCQGPLVPVIRRPLVANTHGLVGVPLRTTRAPSCASCPGSGLRS